MDNISKSRNQLPGGWLARAMTINAMEAARAVLRESQPGPRMENANTPMAAQPIWAMNILYFWNKYTCTHHGFDQQ